jgi:transcriptional regulator with XRE-family HTH domain
MEETSWGPAVVKSIASQVRRYRKERGMSVQQLADVCEQLGWPIKRTVLSNLESGYRETITVPELVVLATALGVPPIQLLYPVGAVEDVELLPGRTVPTEEAVLWFAGWHEPFRDEVKDRVGQGRHNPQTGLHEWYETPYEDAGAPIRLYAEHRVLLQEYEDAVQEAARRLGGDAPAADYRVEVAEIRKRIETALRAKRVEMSRREVAVLPDLPPELAHLR